MKTLLLILALTSASVYAAGPKMFKNMEKVESMCPGLEITKDQKVAIVKALVDMRKASKPLRKDVKAAKKVKKKIIMDAATTKEEAISAIKDFKKVRKPLKVLRKSTMLNIQFDILSGEQRVKILKCLKKPRRGGRS